MSIINNWFFTKTIINWDMISQATANQYRVVSAQPFTDKKGVLTDGYKLTLMILKDSFDYGVDKNGVPRENNIYQNFEATVLTRKHEVKKGDIISLLDFDDEHSFAIGFDLLLRFKDLKIIKTSEDSKHA